MINELMWSCDERDRNNCRNAHGCHCKEITSLLKLAEIRKQIAFQEGIKHLRREIIEGPAEALPVDR